MIFVASGYSDCISGCENSLVLRKGVVHTSGCLLLVSAVVYCGGAAEDNESKASKHTKVTPRFLRTRESNVCIVY